MLFNVLGWITSFGCPDTVVRPSLVGCLNLAVAAFGDNQIPTILPE